MFAKFAKATSYYTEVNFIMPRAIVFIEEKAYFN